MPKSRVEFFGFYSVFWGTEFVAGLGLCPIAREFGYCLRADGGGSIRGLPEDCDLIARLDAALFLWKRKNPLSGFCRVLFLERFGCGGRI